MQTFGMQTFGMRPLATSLTLLLALIACGEVVTPEEQQRRDAQVVTMVEDANAVIPPLVEVVPDPILPADMETHDMLGAACAYAPGTSLGARVLARATDAFIKLDGEIIRFAADPGSRELPSGTRSLYNGREYSLRLEISPSGEQADGAGYDGTISLRDRWEREIYTGSGPAQCGG